MAKFCIQCGKQLEGEELCDCQTESNTAEVASQNTQQTAKTSGSVQNQNGFGDFIKDMFKLSVDFLKDPVSHIKSVSQNEDYKTGLFFVGLQAISVVILILLCIEKSTVIIGGLLGKFSGFLDLYGYDMDIPYFSISMKVLLLVIIQFFVIAGLFYGLGKFIFKGSGSFKSIMGTMGVTTIPATIIVLISIIAVLVMPTTYMKISTYLFIFVTSINALLNFVAVRESLKISEAKTIYLIPVGYIIFAFAASLVLQEMVSNSLMRGIID